MNIDIQTIINQKIAEMDANKVIENTLGEAIEKTVIKAITEALDGYQLRRNIEEKISKQVSSVVNDIGFTAYNSFIAQKVKEITEVVCSVDIAQKIQKVFDEMMIIKRENIKLSELFKKYREWICEQVDAEEKYDLEHPHVKFEESVHGWYEIELAKEKPKDKYSYCSRGEDFIRLAIHKKSDRPGWGWLSRMSVDDVDVKKAFVFGRLSEFELLLINLVYNETPIEIDVTHQDEIDDSYDVDI